MIKKILIVVLTLFCFVNVMAQDLTVRSMESLSMDTYASVHKRVDNNGTACAAVKVSLPLAGATFSGTNHIGSIDRIGADYIIFMPAGSKKMYIQHPNFHELEVVFGDYGIDRLQSVVTYRVTVNVPQMGMPVQQDNGLTYFILNVQPKNAQVTIDGKLQVIDPNGEYSLLLPRTDHTYSVSAGGYATKTETFTLGMERKSLKVSLESTMASLSVTTETSGASIFVNEQKKGTTSWTGTLQPGNYSIEARLDGYYPHSETVALSEHQQKSITIPALIARTGSLDVSYRPNDSEVWIDGKKAGLSPDIFKNLLIGSHKVSIRKEGYKTEEQTVTITEGQTTSLTGALEQGTSYASSSSTVGGALAFTVKGVSFTMMPVEGGTFTMGAGSGKKTVHQVSLSSYYIGETEVTQALWQAVMGSNPSYFKGDQNPVENVNWEDCQIFISKLNELTGKRFRLPTETEWEFAARGGTKSKGYDYSGSNDIVEVAWCYKNSGRKYITNSSWSKAKAKKNNCQVHPVKQKRANELEIYDMTGNVHEWCQDLYDSYSNNAQTNPTGTNSGSDCVFRGGSYYDFDLFCRIWWRRDNHMPPDFRGDNLGLRLALSEF